MSTTEPVTEERERDPEAEPYIPASESLPEITARAVVLGILLSALLGGANAYLGLKVGMTVSASIPAAVISMGILQFFRDSNVLENNIVQTAASAGESLAAGVIFTLPALIVLQYWADFPYVQTVAIAGVGGVLGVLFTVPLRRALILEADLTFPEGIATGEVLKAGSEGGRGVRAIAVGAIAGGIVKLCQTGFKAVASAVEGAVTTGRSVFGFGLDLSVALLAVGYIVGLNIAVLVFLGGCISWLFGIPIYSAMYGLPEGLSGYDAAYELWSTRIRYMGVGAMAVGGIWALLSLVGPIRDGIRSSMQAIRAKSDEDAVAVPRTELDTPINYVLFGTIALAIPTFVVFMYVVDQGGLGITSGLYLGTLLFGVVFALFAGFLFSSVAAYMAGLVGSSNNPISGVTIATILTTSLILLWMLSAQIDFTVGDHAITAAATAILVGAVVCCAAAIGGDNMQDLKAGHIVGATPLKQQIMQMVGVLASAAVIAPVLSLLFHAYGMAGVFPRAGMPEEAMLDAPQATLMASVAQGVFAQNLPWGMIIVGALIAVAIIVFDQILKARGSDFRAPVLAVAVGIYLPIELSVPIFIGGLVAYFASRSIRSRDWSLTDLTTDEAEKHGARNGLLFSSGLIAGEALIGILLAIPFAAYESSDVLRLVPTGFAGTAQVIGVLAFAGFTFWLYRVAARPKAGNGGAF